MNLIRGKTGDCDDPSAEVSPKQNADWSEYDLVNMLRIPPGVATSGADIVNAPQRFVLGVGLKPKLPPLVFALLLHHDFWFLSHKQSLHYFARLPQPAGSMSFLIMASRSHEPLLKSPCSLCFLYLCQCLPSSLPSFCPLLVDSQVFQHPSRSVWVWQSPLLPASAPSQPAGSPHRQQH